MEAAVVLQVHGLMPGGQRQHDVNVVLLLLVALLVLAVVLGDGYEESELKGNHLPCA